MNIQNIPLDLIDEDTNQPRNYFNKSALDELVNSIREVGLLTPIKVYKTNNERYKIIFGNRRYKAFKILNIKEIPCLVSSITDELEIIIEQLTENIQRESFSPIEEARSFQNLLSDGRFKVSLLYLSSKIGKTESYIRRKLDLLIFGKSIQELVISGSEITQNQLIEDQLLPLKSVDIEYRDPLALIVARDKVAISEVKKIASIFKDTSIKPETKENLLSLSGSDLLSTWGVLEQEKEEMKKFTGPTGIISKKTEDPAFEVTKRTPIEEILHEMISKVPSHRKISLDTVYSFEKINIDSKEQFLSGVDDLIENLEAHLIEWKKIRDLAKKTTIKVIK